MAEKDQRGPASDGAVVRQRVSTLLEPGKYVCRECSKEIELFVRTLSITCSGKHVKPLAMERKS